MNTKSESEFGQGLMYNLGLFLAHAMQDYYLPDERKKIRGVEMWFYGATDHFYDFEWQSAPTPALKKRCKVLRDKCLTWRLPMNEIDKPTEKDKLWALSESKEILRAVDKFLGVNTIKGEWE